MSEKRIKVGWLGINNLPCPECNALLDVDDWSTETTFEDGYFGISSYWTCPECGAKFIGTGGAKLAGLELNPFDEDEDLVDDGTTYIYEEAAKSKNARPSARKPAVRKASAARKTTTKRATARKTTTARKPATKRKTAGARR